MNWASLRCCRWKAEVRSPPPKLPRSRVLFTTTQIEAAYDAMAAAISAELATLEPVILAVLKGGMVTAVELLKRFDFPCELDYVHVARYGNSTKGGELAWVREPGEGLMGRHVLLVDDILDEGVTVAALRARLDTLGVAKVLTAVLLSKNSPTRTVPVEFVGLRVDAGYVFGCGMDYQGHWRGLNEIRVLED